MDSTFALEDSDLLTLNALRNLFTKGVKSSLPDGFDAFSRLFEKDSILLKYWLGSQPFILWGEF